MQSAPATVRLKHAQCIKSKTGEETKKQNKKKTQPPQTVRLALSTHPEARINHENPFDSISLCGFVFDTSVCQSPSARNEKTCERSAIKAS